jgi:hypothetical protein
MLGTLAPEIRRRTIVMGYHVDFDSMGALHAVVLSLLLAGLVVASVKLVQRVRRRQRDVTATRRR